MRQIGWQAKVHSSHQKRCKGLAKCGIEQANACAGEGRSEECAATAAHLFELDALHPLAQVAGALDDLLDDERLVLARHVLAEREAHRHYAAKDVDACSQIAAS
eukprot:2317022-Pleurochrysis_carterae.AAC.2